MLVRLLVLAATATLAFTPGCKRKAQSPITPLPSARAGQGGIPNPSPLGPNGGTADRSGRLPGDGSTGGTDLGGPAITTVTPPPAGENVPLGDGPFDRSKFSENRSQFASEVLYFDFDSAVVKSSEKSKTATVADYLKSNANAAVEVEGHCDERGTEEYNRSLGDRRAQAVREELAQAGVDPKRIFIISYGEDRPAVNGHDEVAWGKNRRGEFVLLTPR